MSALDRVGLQFIDGQWVPSASDARVRLTNASTGATIGDICAGAAEDVDNAVAAARRAFAGWAETTVASRIAILRRAAQLLEQRAEELALLITDEVGTPISVSRQVQVLRPIQVLRSLCDAGDNLQWAQELDNTLVVHEPLGVVAAITPWNFPLHQTVAKVGAALVSGCAVVAKPSELAPLSTYVLADVLTEAGVPAGVINVITGVGDRVGDPLVSHPDVDGISFTGSTAVGRHIGEVAARTVKRVALELGGKGPSVVLPGADVAAAATATAARCFVNSGQVCAALSRLIVPRADLATAEQALTAFISAQKLGDPTQDDTTLGPVISAQQKDRVQTYIDSGVSDGARMVVGSTTPPAGGGNFIAPVVFSDVTSKMTIAQEEIFGPVLCVMPYDSVDDAVRIANDSAYGLVGAVWATNVDQAAQVAAKLRVGMVGVNGGRINVAAPFGGYAQSGNGREFGTFGLLEFLETKSINYATPADIRRPAELT